MQHDSAGQPSERHTRDLQILNAVAESLNSAADVRQALEHTLGLVAELLGLQTGWVWLVDRDTGRFYSAAAQNLPPYLQQPVRMTGKACWCILSFQAGKLAPKNIDVLECSRLQPAVRAGALDQTRGLRYHASIPLYFRDTPLGIMNVTSPTWRSLSADELQLLSTIAYQVGIAVERARLAEERTRLARAEERTRIAREIHDTLAQGLTAIALHVESAMRQMDRDPDRARERLEQALSTARGSLEEARRSVLALRAGPDGPLPQALATLGRALTADTGVRVRVHADQTLTLSAEMEAELFRIAQEALANIRRHAGATEVEILLRQSGRDVTLSIRDDGCGFDPGGVREGHHGVLGMRERAALLGGRLDVASGADGTSVIATVPLSEAGA